MDFSHPPLQVSIRLSKLTSTHIFRPLSEREFGQFPFPRKLQAEDAKTFKNHPSLPWTQEGQLPAQDHGETVLLQTSDHVQADI